MAVTRNRKIGIAIAGGAAVAGVFAASAASIGTLTVADLGTGANVVASCTNSASITGWGATGLTYSGASTATSTTGSTFKNNTLTINAGASCSGRGYKVVVATNTGSSLGETSGTLSSSGYAGGVTYTPSADSKLIEQVTLTVFG